MTDTITEVDMDLMRRTALRAVHPRATITGGTVGAQGREGTLIPADLVNASRGHIGNGHYTHAVVLDEGVIWPYFNQQGTGMWAESHLRWVTLDEVDVTYPTAEQIVARLPRYTDGYGTCAAAPLGTFGDGAYHGSMALAVMPGANQPHNGWPMDSPQAISMPDTWPLQARDRLWGWWLSSPDGTWALPGNLPATEPSFEVGQRVRVEDEDEVTSLRRELNREQEKYRRDLAAISEILRDEAIERDWCGEYEQVVAKINRNIDGELEACREQDMTVSVTVRGEARIPWRIDLNVDVEARDEDSITHDQVAEAVRAWLQENYVEHANPTLDTDAVSYDSTYSLSEVEIDDEWEVN